MAKYEQTVHQDSRISVTVIFQSPALTCHNSPFITRISGVESFDTAIAEHTTALETIKYMENVTNTVIRDLNYDHLKYADEENKHVRKQLRATKPLLKKETLKSKKLARDWFWAVRNMFSFSSQFYNVAIIANFGAHEVLRNHVKATFATIYDATD